jgi:hypothetical protein
MWHRRRLSGGHMVALIGTRRPIDPILRRGKSDD